MKNNIKAIILGLVLTVGMGYAVAATFTGPKCAPPDCNADAPVTIGGNDVGIVPYSQLKTGLLTLMSVITPDLTVRNADPSPVIPDQVLTAINSDGKVGWKSLPSQMSRASGIVLFNTTSDDSWIVPNGASFAKVTVIGAAWSQGTPQGGVISTGYGGVAQKIISVSPGDVAQIHIGRTSRPASQSKFTLGSIEINATNGSYNGYYTSDGNGIGGDLNFSGPYLDFGGSAGGAVIVEFY
ncbi:MAG: hypothetical protein AAB610_02020 [Patescibacteria group bacterium]